MKIHLLSDLHLEYAPLDVTPRADADVVVLAGDIAVGAAGVDWARRSFRDQPVLYVPGNHEFYGGEASEVLATMHAAAAGSQVCVLDRAAKVVGGTRFLAATLWTDFRLFAGEDASELMWAQVDARRGVPDFDGRIRVHRDGETAPLPLSPEISRQWHAAARAWLASELERPFDGPTVVITHHAPSPHSIPPEYLRDPLTPAYASRLEPMMARADLWLHGHTHSPADYRIGRCRVVCNPRGYETESEGFDPALLLDLPPAAGKG